MIDIPQKKKKIISFLESNGPSLPVRIAREIDLSPVFTSAILSELLQNKDIMLSNLKIGSSPLYFIPGQEEKLERYMVNLKGIEKEVLLKLKKKTELEDESQEPAFRIALRNLRDFAKPFKRGEKIFWRYAFSKKNAPEETIHREKNKKQTQIKKIKNFPEKNSSKDDFFRKVKKFIESKNFKFIEKIQSDKKEIVAKINLQTDIGDINFLLIAKNKRTTNKEEVSSALQRSGYEKMPCIYLLLKDPPKSIKSMIEENKNLFKILVLEETQP